MTQPEALAPATCLGDPVLDVVARVPHQLLEQLQAEPGGCIRVEQEEMQRLMALPEVQEHAARWAGGCGARSMQRPSAAPRGLQDFNAVCRV